MSCSFFFCVLFLFLLFTLLLLFFLFFFSFNKMGWLSPSCTSGNIKQPPSPPNLTLVARPVQRTYESYCCTRTRPVVHIKINKLIGKKKSTNIAH